MRPPLSRTAFPFPWSEHPGFDHPVPSVKPNVIHAQSSTLPERPGTVLPAQHPYVVTCHGLGLATCFRRYLDPPARLLPLPKGGSRAQHSHKTHIIPNGIDTDVFTPPPGQKGPCKALVCGPPGKRRLEPLKYLVEANAAMWHSSRSSPTGIPISQAPSTYPGRLTLCPTCSSQAWLPPAAVQLGRPQLRKRGVSDAAGL